MIITPAILFSVCWWSRRVEPIPVAVIPSATNITVNERQKISAGSRIRLSRFSPARISAMLEPEIAER